ncbi:DNA/RNA non-specific endonuclease [Actinomyces sp. MRS3W]|uniref:DNA/RNA non-specific endonuclease n=1 Tax=Actinomyces sp. MRS3W TaxID=2800796 RepID=UPI0028FD9798|nr:DNA/RNA non-specific endonuclease [Actinomyces sp. MRS3W]MDU0348896.1 DNA/RNA non-specific endonuclease [Actinomyces sp. MRS3W]
MTTPFDETKIPGLTFDVESLDTAATNLETKAGDLRTSGDDVKTTWAGIQNVYKAPEQETLYAAMDPVATDTDTLATALESMAGYLSTFADSMSGIKTRAQSLETKALAFKTKIQDNPEWDHDQDLVDENNVLIATANGIQVDMWDAERTCANNIRALDGLAGYHADPTGDDDELGYGYSEIPEGTEGMPWGSPVDRQDSCPKKAGVAVKRFLWDGLVCEGLGGMVNGVLNLGGFQFEGSNGFTHDGDRAVAILQGLAMLVGVTWNEDGSYAGHDWSTAGAAWKETGKGILCWDQWEDDPARAAGGTVFNIGSVLIPYVGIATKFTSAASRVGKVARWAQAASKVLSYMDPLGVVADMTLGKVAKVVMSKVDFSFSGFELPGRKSVGDGVASVDVDVRTDLPDVDVDAGARRPHAHGDGTNPTPDLGDVDLRRGGVDVDTPDVGRTPDGDSPDGSRRSPDADVTPDGERAPDGDRSSDTRTSDADAGDPRRAPDAPEGPDASDKSRSPDVSESPDSPHSPDGRDVSDSPDAKDSPDGEDRRPDYDPDKDAFNQEHRPKTEQSVKVDEDSPLAPRPRSPFGKGVDLDPNTCYEVEGRGKYYTNDAGEVVHVEAKSAVQRQTWLGRTSETMNPDLKDPLPNATYTVDGKFHYTTDDWGRTVRIQVDRLDVVDEASRYRSESVQDRVGGYGDAVGGGYDGGHLAGSKFAGPPEDINVLPMLEDLNRGTNGTYMESFKKLEDDIAANPDAYWNIDIVIEYDGPPTNAESVTRLGDVEPADRVPKAFEVYSEDAGGQARDPSRFRNR